MLTEDGACSVPDELAPVPYDLTGILGGRSDQATRRLALLERLVERAQETTGSDWVGIYQRRVNPAGLPVLVKLSYVGRPSRAEFPAHARNSPRAARTARSGLTGRALVIDDVKKHVQAGRRLLRVRRARCSRRRACRSSTRRRTWSASSTRRRSRGRSTAPVRLATLAALAIVASAVLP